MSKPLVILFITLLHNKIELFHYCTIVSSEIIMAKFIVADFSIR